MRPSAPCRLAALACLAVLTGCGMPMQNIMAENRAVAWSGNIATCEDAGVLASITTRFAQAQSGLAGKGRQIEQIESIRETGLRRNGRSYIPRRDCRALARLDDASLHAVYYTVIAGIDAYGLADRVEFCVAAYDPYHLGPSACTRMSR